MAPPGKHGFEHWGDGFSGAACSAEEGIALEAAGSRRLEDEIRLLRVLVRRLVLDQETALHTLPDGGAHDPASLRPGTRRAGRGGDPDTPVALIARCIDVPGRVIRTPPSTMVQPMPRV